MFLDDGLGIGVTVYAGVWFEFEESHAAPLGWADKVPFGTSLLEIINIYIYKENNTSLSTLYEKQVIH